MRRNNFRLSTGLLPIAALAVALTAAPRRLYAAPVNRTVLSLKTLHDAGGANPKGPDGLSINVRFSMALRKALSQFAQGRFAVTGVDHEDPAVSGETRYVLEGDLSHLELGSKENEPYLCTLRLFTAGKPRRLLGQWAGTASTLRELTGNLRRDPAFDRLGLAGELAKRIASTLSGGNAAELEDLLRSASQLHRVTVEAAQEGGDGEAAARGSATLAAGRKFRLKVSSLDAGSVYLLQRVNGKAAVLFAPEEPLDVAPGRSALLPPDAALTAEKEWVGTPREYIALVRVRNASALHLGSGGPRLAVLEAPPADGGASSVQVVGDGASAVVDPALARLLGQFHSDPPGTWSAAIVKVSVR